MLETINQWLPVATALLGILAFIWKLNRTLILLNENIKELNSVSKDSKQKLDNHEIRIVVLETVTGIKQVKGDVHND